MKFKKIVIIGMGLIGGSIGKALLKKRIAKEVVGVCRRPSSLKRAVKCRVLTSGHVNEYKKAVKGADIIVIATPVHTIKEVLGKLSKVLKGDVIVTDVGSTKKEIMNVASKYGKNFMFVGSHPLAGSEKTGVENVKADLFKGTVVVVTKDRKTSPKAVRIVENLWKALGAKVVTMSPERHDSVLAFTSHLPHVVAYALAVSVNKGLKDFAATGFKDTTRIASSDPLLWKDIFLSNRKDVLASYRAFYKNLSAIARAVRANDGRRLQKVLTNCKDSRDALVGK